MVFLPLTGNFDLSDYVAANVNQLHFNMFKWACEEMKNQIVEMDGQLDEMDREHSTNNPDVIREYLAGSDEEKLMMEVSRYMARDCQFDGKEKSLHGAIGVDRLCSRTSRPMLNLSLRRNGTTGGRLWFRSA